jgi:hypothetical protein
VSQYTYLERKAVELNARLVALLGHRLDGGALVVRLNGIVLAVHNLERVVARHPRELELYVWAELKALATGAV